MTVVFWQTLRRKELKILIGHSAKTPQCSECTRPTCRSALQGRRSYLNIKVKVMACIPLCLSEDRVSTQHRGSIWCNWPGPQPAIPETPPHTQPQDPVKSPAQGLFCCQLEEAKSDTDFSLMLRPAAGTRSGHLRGPGEAAEED